MKANRKTKPGGFTVAELLMVVVIIGLITGAGTGLYVGSFKRMQVEKTACDFFLTAKYARLMAVERQSYYKMELDQANGAFQLTTVVWDEDTGQAQQEVVKNMYCKPVEFQGGVVYESVNIAPSGLEISQDEKQQTIIFSPNGTAQASVIQIGDGTTHYTISISPATGRAKMSFGTAENVTVGTTDLEAE